jgi:hypothetical protein
MAVWRRDDEVGQSFALKLTAAGMRAIAVDEEGDRLPASSASSEPTIDESDDAQTTQSRAIPTPREGTKIARVKRLAAARGRRDTGRTHCRDGLVAAYHPRGDHGPPQARLYAHTRPIQ